MLILMTLAASLWALGAIPSTRQVRMVHLQLGQDLTSRTWSCEGSDFNRQPTGFLHICTFIWELPAYQEIM